VNDFKGEGELEDEDNLLSSPTPLENHKIPLLHPPCDSHSINDEVGLQSHLLRDEGKQDEFEIQLTSHPCSAKERGYEESNLYKTEEELGTNSSQVLPFIQSNKKNPIRNLTELGLHPLDPSELIETVSCTLLPETKISSSDLPSKPVPRSYNSNKNLPFVHAKVYSTSSKVDDVERGEDFHKASSTCASIQINRKNELRLKSVHSKEKCQNPPKQKGISSMCSVNLLCGYIFWNLRKMNLSPKFQTYVITLCSGLLLYVSDLFSDIVNGIFLLCNGKKS
jgi:hypothetical protein